MQSHTIHKNCGHFGWDNSLDPILLAKPGDVIEIETVDASGGQINSESDASGLNDLDFSKINPVTGPVFVEGAEPGDAIAVKFLEFAQSDWGWTALIPGFGLLADEFPEPCLHIWNIDTCSSGPCLFGAGGKIPLKPFCGTVGLALSEPGLHSVVPPRRVGGNLDIRDNCVGTTLYLPVEVDGGLLSIGDTHAAQGDGEVCGTAIESPMTVSVEIGLIKSAGFDFPRFETEGPVTRHIDGSGYFIATGIGPDLMLAVKDSVKGMIDWLCASQDLSDSEAYMLCSICGDLRISQIVDLPNWTVSFYFPKRVFD
ncbi:MAG: acetamidase/formamidase family protein [Albidovulum sp.]|nr:acetamidase/formamidase family protein [Albidovulum sp.]